MEKNEGKERQYLGYIYGRQKNSELVEYAFLYEEDDQLNFEVHFRKFLKTDEWIDEDVETNSIFKLKCTTAYNKISFIGEIKNLLPYMLYRFLKYNGTTDVYMKKIKNGEGNLEILDKMNIKLKEYFGNKKGEKKKEERKADIEKVKHYIGYMYGTRTNKPCIDYVFFYVEDDILKFIPGVYNKNTKTFYKNQWSVLSRHIKTTANLLKLDKNLPKEDYNDISVFMLNNTVSLNDYWKDAFTQNGETSSFEKLTELVKNLKQTLIENKEKQILNTSIHKRMILLGWIEENKKLRTAICLNATASVSNNTITVYTFNIDTLTEEASSIFFNFDKQKMYIQPDVKYIYHCVNMETENIKLDIRFLENRKLSCTVEKDDFAKSIKMNIEDFNYDALVDLLRERNISASELAKKAKLL